MAQAIADGKVLAELPLDTFVAAHPAIDETIFAALDMETAVERRDLPGGPARARVAAATAELAERLTLRGVDIASLASDALEGAAAEAS